MEGVYRLSFDCGRAGKLDGVFLADSEDVKILVDEKIWVYFGEALGKHSEVCGPVDSREITLVTEDAQVVKIFEEFELSSGYNPFNYPLDYDSSVKYFPNSPDDRGVYEVIELLRGKA